MTVTDDRSAGDDWGPPGRLTGRQLREQLADDGWLDDLIDRAGQSGVQLTGEGGFLPELVKAVLERGLDAELTDHLGYERGDPAGRGSPNSRYGTTPERAGVHQKAARQRGARLGLPGWGLCRWTCRGIGPAASSRGWCPRANA